MNARLDRGYANGEGQEAIARDVGVSRSAVITQAGRLRLVKAAAVAAPSEPAPVHRREPLPSGHSVTWGSITNDTVLAGARYTPPGARA
jgi:hypothetical protein